MPRGGRREKAGRKSGWVNSETQLIRVPKVFADRLLEIAKHLDRGDEFHLIERQIETEPTTLPETMETEPLVGQLDIFSIPQDLDSRPQPLSGRKLATRLKVSSGTLVERRQKGSIEDLLTWTHSKDGKWGWFYSSRDEKYHPIHPSEFDHVLSELSYENF